MPLEQINGTTVYYYHADQLGSTRAMTDAAGTVQQTYEFDPYGNAVTSIGTLTNPLRYGGQYFDAESGLYYLRARYYDPVVAQFLSRDPASASVRQVYQYVHDTPLNASDPSGLRAWTDLGCHADTFHQWVKNNTEFIRSEAAVADKVATAMSVLAGVCGIMAVAGAIGVVTAPIAAIGVGCAGMATGLALGSTIAAATLHGFAAWGLADSGNSYGAETELGLSFIDFASLPLAALGGGAVAACLRGTGRSATHELAHSFGAAAVGLYSDVQRRALGN